VNTVSSSNEYGNSLTYDYDSLNRPNAVVDGGKTTTINYDGVGNISQINLPNGVAVTYVYDNLNRLTAVKALLTSNSSFLTDFEYTLGPTGNRLSVTEVSGRAVTWTPDDLYRLTDESIVVDPSGNTGDVAYTYDNVGNRYTRSTSITGLVSQNFTGGYTTADLLKPTFNFDDNGNQLSDAQGRTYTYNSLNQLTHVTGTNVDVSYVYDGDGLRVQKTSNGTTTNYLWDRNNLTGYPQVSEELQSGQVVRRYVYGPKGPLYMVQLVGSSWVTSYYGLDATGSVRFLMNDSGQITDQYTRDAFGNLLSSSGVGTVNSIGLDGEYAEPETGLVYLRARWYDPTTGRFLQMDSFEGENAEPYTLSKYIFCENDPINRMDASGNADVRDLEQIPGLDKVFPTTYERLKSLPVEIFVKFRKLGSVLGFDYHHSYILARNPEAKKYYYFAGFVNNENKLYGVSDPDFGPQNGWDYTVPPVCSIQYGSASKDYDGIVTSFKNSLTRISGESHDYHYFSNNCNAFTCTLLTDAGIEPGEAPVRAPGWGTALH
jgi:RHS repeat-associated protein